MYNFITLVAAVAATAAPLVSAVGSARVVNNCGSAVTVWSVGQNVAGPYSVAANGGSYGETFVKDPVTGGKALKITLQPDGLYTGAPQTIFAYNLDTDANQIWYDLSDVFGDAFAGSKLVEASSDATCPQIVWSNGTPPAGSQVKVCSANSDVTLTLCA
ncbi:putative bys1 family protein [Diplogelasinospora grovesii]|uniref:Bys1 family protein n=1 Tax=Diplogelasinospora grovesii TaxID=303347 RepID=A0AAN6S758_9PEZI|nr:putative bys1 family protein [Diplogelasinospora grovesii]